MGDYPRFILPGPLVVAERFATGWAQGTIGPHFATTLIEVLLGLLVGGLAGLLTGILLARSRLAARLLSPYIVAAQATPILALAPLIALWFGTGLASRLLICALICFFPIAVGTMVGIRSVDPRLMELGRSLRASRWQLLRHVEMPSALPQILGGLRIGVDARRRGRHRGRVGGRRPGPGRPRQPGARQHVRHPAACSPRS